MQTTAHDLRLLLAFTTSPELKARIQAELDNTCLPNHEPTVHCPECRHLVK